MAAYRTHWFKPVSFSFNHQRYSVETIDFGTRREAD
jgi:hypothetical protein